MVETANLYDLSIVLSILLSFINFILKITWKKPILKKVIDPIDTGYYHREPNKINKKLEKLLIKEFILVDIDTESSTIQTKNFVVL